MSDDDCDVDEADDAGAAGDGEAAAAEDGDDATTFCFFVGGADDEPLRFLAAFFGTGYRGQRPSRDSSK